MVRIDRKQQNSIKQLSFNSKIDKVAKKKEPTCQCRRCESCSFDPWVKKISWRRAWQPTPVFLPGESRGQRSLEGYILQGHKESDTTEVTWHSHAVRAEAISHLSESSIVHDRCLIQTRLLANIC